jgi:hypothetical protein
MSAEQNPPNMLASTWSVSWRGVPTSACCVVLVLYCIGEHACAICVHACKHNTPIKDQVPHLQHLLLRRSCAQGS